MGEEAKIDMISVTTKHQGKGIEQELLNNVEDQLFGMSLKAHIPSKDKKRMDIFKDQGFEVVENYIRGQEGQYGG